MNWLYKKPMGSRDLKTPYTRKLAIISASILLLFCVIVTLQAIWTHEEAIERGKLIAQRLTEIHSDNIELTLNAVDISLRGIVERQYYNSLFGQKISNEVENDFKNWIENSPQLAWVLLADAEGKVKLVSSKKSREEWASSLSSIKQKGFFKEHKRNKKNLRENLNITIDNSEDLVDNKLIILSRSVYNFDGSFSGVVVAAVDSRYFFEFFQSMEYSEKIAMGIFIGDKKIILSSMKSKIPLELMDFTVADLDELNLQKNTIRIMPRVAGNTEYLVTSKKIPALPVYLNLAFDRDQILEGWRSDRITDFIFFMLFTAFGAVLFFLVLAMAKQIKRAEESEQRALLANQAKSEFLAKMSHELRTPLNAIIGFSEMIDSGYFGPLSNKKQQERVHDINLCGNHLLQLINDILDYSKGEAGKLEIRDSEVGVIRIIDESVRMVQEKAKAKRIKIENNIPETFPRIIVDERKIKQILINLLSNSIKFTEKEGYISISGHQLADGGLKISVKDNGIGMSNEDIPMALSVFGQIKTKIDQEDEGTGLGLPLCKMLTELHGGVFEVESALGKGTTASIILPKARVVE